MGLAAAAQAGCLQEFQLTRRGFPSGLELDGPFVMPLGVGQLGGDLVEMPELQVQVRVLGSHAQGFEVVMLGEGKLARLLQHMAALDMQVRAARRQPQRLAVQGGGVRVALLVLGGARPQYEVLEHTTGGGRLIGTVRPAALEHERSSLRLSGPSCAPWRGEAPYPYGRQVKFFS